MHKEIGFDRIYPYEYVNNQRKLLPDIPFAEWDNIYFSCGTPGSVAARYCAVLSAYRNFREDFDPDEPFTETLQLLQRKGKSGVKQLSLSVTEMMSVQGEFSEVVQRQANQFFKELAQYNQQEQTDVQRPKPKRKQSQER